ncbi:MFS general substrate transporter [Atractiella rhizophila]|nr:MFS general substrate transporter [Atractiella rhizophila]
MEAITPQAAPSDFPDGGRDAWLVVLGAWCVGFATFGVVNGWGACQNYYSTHQLSDKNQSDISWIGSLQLAFLFFGGVISGRLFDAGYLHVLMGIGTILSSLCFFLTSICTEYWHFILCQGLGMGIGFGILFIPAVSCISHWWKGRRGLALGVMMTGSSIGGIIFPIMFNKLFHSSIGFGWAIRAAALVELVVLMIANVTLKARLPPRKKGHFIQLSALKENGARFTLCFKSTEFVTEFVLLFGGCFFVLLGLYVPIFYLETFAQKAGVSPTLVEYVLPIFNAASIFGRWLPNWYADRLGPFNVHIPCTFISGALVFVWLATGNTGGTIAFAIIYGFTSGVWQSTIPAMMVGTVLSLVGLPIQSSSTGQDNSPDG